MRTGRALFLAIAALGVFGAAVAFAATGTVSWGYAIEVPGSAALNTAGRGAILSLSCPGAGKCAAGGYYRGGSGFEALVVSEKNAEWGRAVELPGIEALNTGGEALVTSVSCATAGNCAAGGYYDSGSAEHQAFVANEVNGIWGSAVEVPGTATLNAGGSASLDSVSCPSPGNCAGAGSYADGSGHQQVFVVSEKNGVWGSAIEVPGTAARNVGGGAFMGGVSCASAGNCAAGGYYTDGAGHGQAFVVNEKSGVWGSAIEVPGTAALNAGGGAVVLSVSCAGVGTCAGGGSYVDGAGHLQAFVVSEKNGVWRKAIEVPGTATLNAGGEASVDSVSCAPLGNCAAGGSYRDGSGHYQAFVASETNGVWHRAKEVPGTAALNTGGYATVQSVSCAGAGKCVAGGNYSAAGDDQQAFVVGENAGVWGAAKEVPGTAALNVGVASVNSVSCAKSGRCAVAGYYSDSVSVLQAFVTAP